MTDTANSQRDFITVVSGLPRSGTSLMMQMLHAGGMPVLTDDARGADEDNPRGYLEFEGVKHLKSDPSWLEAATGKAVKIIHMLLPDLPTDRKYRIILMQRDLDEVIRSQNAMLERLGRQGSSLSTDRLKAVYESQLASVKRWLQQQPSIAVFELGYAQVIENPPVAANRVAQFLHGGLDLDAMAAAVDPNLYRNRSWPR